MKCNLCGVVAEGFGTRMWNGEPIPLKRCVDCRSYFKEWRKAPGTKARVTEARVEAKPERKISKKQTAAAYRKTDHAKAKAATPARKKSHLQSQRKWAKTPKGQAKSKRSHARRYVKRRADPDAWLAENIRIGVGQAMRGKGFLQTVKNYTEFTSAEDINNHVQRQFTAGMTSENRGNKHGHWSLGHRIPRVYYNPREVEDLKRCWKKVNVFPQWHVDNAKQGVDLPPDSELQTLIDAGCGPSILGGVVPSIEVREKLRKRAIAGMAWA